ncbi:nuclear transport factor 2 family protein [Nocardia spumae]|uniref:nuclear transport factor 2 family protein n=1 Tax=Nocardia spumae TaxID=2887190 RepID=UPI001D13CEE7|nr:nuclear transport factor 2 family protein [Nocardia spumae]
MSDNDDPQAVVLRLWAALARRDWDEVGSLLSEDCIYLDVPTGPTLAAKGPADTVKRLRIGLAGLSEYTNHDGLLVANGPDVIYEHSETWVWPTGERADLPFVSVHRVDRGRVSLWKDYWNFDTLSSAAPPSWMEDFAAADMSWIYDATAELSARSGR